MDESVVDVGRVYPAVRRKIWEGEAAKRVGAGRVFAVRVSWVWSVHGVVRVSRGVTRRFSKLILPRDLETRVIFIERKWDCGLNQASRGGVRIP